MQFVNPEDHEAQLAESATFRDEDGILWHWNGEHWRIVPEYSPSIENDS
jgi:hypothetical protein